MADGRWLLLICNLYADGVIQLDMAVETGAGRDKANPAGMRVHKMKKKAGDVENSAYGQENLDNNELCRSSGSS